MKAPSLDGMPALFLKIFWHIIGEDFSKAALLILNERGGVGKWNNKLITLIPKFKKPKLVKDFRPISLCDLIYKIVSRVIIGLFGLVIQILKI